jgi:hypothetical protein
MVEPRAIWLGGAVCMAVGGLILMSGKNRENQGGLDAPSEPLSVYLQGLVVLARNSRTWSAVCANAALIGPLVLWQLRLGGSLPAVLLGFIVMKAAAVIGGRLISGRTVPRWMLSAAVLVNLVAMAIFATVDAKGAVVTAFGVHVVTHIAISVYCAAQFQRVVPDNRRAGATSVVSLLGSALTAFTAVAVGELADRGSAILAVVPSMTLYGLVVLFSVLGRSERHNRDQEPDATRATSAAGR